MRSTLGGSSVTEAMVLVDAGIGAGRRIDISMFAERFGQRKEVACSASQWEVPQYMDRLSCIRGPFSRAPVGPGRFRSVKTRGNVANGIK